jgi:hypothetical protein
MRWQKLILSFKLLCLIVLFSQLTGCLARSREQVILYPVRDTDIRVEGDEVIMSKWYLDTVLKVKLEEGR